MSNTTTKLEKAWERYYARQAAKAALLGTEPRHWAHRWMDPRSYYHNTKRHLAPWRIVGTIMPETARLTDNDGHSYHIGWYDNERGESFKDGTGLIWGVVVQLTGKRGKPRFMAGYEVGGDDYGLEVKPKVYTDSVAYSGKDFEFSDAFTEAARAADHMAQQVAEDERDSRCSETEDLFDG